MAFSYTGSALSALVDGLTNNAAPVITLFNDLKTYINGTAWVDDTMLASPNNVAYKTVLSALPLGIASTAAATYVYDNPNSWTDKTSSASAQAAFYLDPADYAVAGKTAKYRLVIFMTTLGASVTGQTMTYGLYPVSSISGGVPTLGTVTSGSTVAFTSQAINVLGHANSGDFAAPAAGSFAVGVTWTGSLTAVPNAGFLLQARNT